MVTHSELEQERRMELISMLIGSGIASMIMYGAHNWKDANTTKMLHVFKNTNYKVGDRLPKLIKKRKYTNKIEYVFSVPYGLIDKEELQPILEKTLMRHVEVMFKGKLIVNIYHHRLPTRTDYSFTKMKGWRVPIGISHNGTVYHDFDSMQHMTIAGTSQWGKTSFIKMLTTALIENHPYDVELYVLDLKGMLSFNRFRNLKQVKGVAGNFSESATVLKQVERDIKSTMQYFSDNYIENINETNITTRKFIIIDEAGELITNKEASAEDKKHALECRRIISHIARVSAALGYRLIYATQYPTAEIMDNQIKANASARISFRLQTSVQSGVAIDEGGAEKLAYKGRAIYRTVDRHEIQTPFINGDEMWERLRRYNVDSNEGKDTETGTDIVKFI